MLTSVFLICSRFKELYLKNAYLPTFYFFFLHGLNLPGEKQRHPLRLNFFSLLLVYDIKVRLSKFPENLGALKINVNT